MIKPKCIKKEIDGQVMFCFLQADIVDELDRSWNRGYKSGFKRGKYLEIKKQMKEMFDKIEKEIALEQSLTIKR